MKTVKTNSRMQSLEKSCALLPSALTRQTGGGRAGREIAKFPEIALSNQR